ncbi:hypothetical protein H257_10098 [Aphanomyces astaci]|uniref:FAM86 N-terminal domain-containing protein n=2 Tax=Aphanomyces astaci TaxID=112090 RepID=W4G7N3_APHAT|nr:hypothetical protein H257_10098 [Aphanomyces astaci]ETV75717.1 hypothetical protein H257_10098 [Aphanomyces astaci]|eukprot:XP_009834848.1 hypothetical protein H257_10098 [Aphanomyces astaci]
MTEQESIVVTIDAVRVCEERIRIGVRDKELDLTLLLDEDELAPLFAGAAWAGTLVWDAAVVLANHLLNDVRLESLRVLELGAGIGVPGMVASILGAKHVVITEQPELVPLLRTNIRRNFPNGGVTATALSWGVAATNAFCDSFGAFDVVLSCDCIYQPLYGESWCALAVTMDVLCKRNPACVVLVSVERRHEDGIDAFLAYLPEATSLHATLYRTIPKIKKSLGDEGVGLELYRITLIQQ